MASSSNPDHWQCDRNLPKCLEYMLDKQIICDVTFIVGAEHEEVHAHKFVLISRSPVFYAMFEGPLAEKGKVELPDVEKDIFLVFLRYLYTDICYINFDNAMELMYIAKKYCVDQLVKVCADFLKDNISADTVCQIMEASRAISESDVYDQCLSFIQKNILDCLKSNDFPTLSMKCLEDIMVNENFTVKEEELYENLMRWAESECQRQKLDASWQNKRKVLGDLLYKVHFPRMEPAYFSRHIATTDLLSDAEKVDVMLYHSTEKDIVPRHFPERERMLQVMRCKVSNKGSTCMSDETACLGFKVSHDSSLYGILVYGCNSGTCEYSLEVEVLNHATKVIVRQVETKINTSSDTKLYHIMFGSSLHVEAGKLYVVYLNMCGKKKMYRAGKEITERPFGVENFIDFYNASTEGNGDTCFGQIPGLLLS